MSTEKDFSYNSPSFRGHENTTLDQRSSIVHPHIASPSTQVKCRNMPFSTHRPSNNFSYEIINQMNFPSSISPSKRAKQFQDIEILGSPDSPALQFIGTEKGYQQIRNQLSVRQRHNEAASIIRKFQSKFSQNDHKIESLLNKSKIEEHKQMKHSTGDNWWVPKSQQGDRTFYLSPNAVKNMQKVNQSLEDKKKLISSEQSNLYEAREDESNTLPVGHATRAGSTIHEKTQRMSEYDDMSKDIIFESRISTGYRALSREMNFTVTENTTQKPQSRQKYLKQHTPISLMSKEREKRFNFHYDRGYFSPPPPAKQSSRVQKKGSLDIDIINESMNVLERGRPNNLDHIQSLLSVPRRRQNKSYTSTINPKLGAINIQPHLRKKHIVNQHCFNHTRGTRQRFIMQSAAGQGSIVSIPNHMTNFKVDPSIAKIESGGATVEPIQAQKSNFYETFAKRFIQTSPQQPPEPEKDPETLKQEKYLMKDDHEGLMQKLDKEIERKRAANSDEFHQLMHEKAVLNCMQPKKGQSMVGPCQIKLRAFNFLANQVSDPSRKTNIQKQLQEANESQEHISGMCTHNYSEDESYNFLQNIIVWIEYFESTLNLPDKQKIKKQKLLRNFMDIILESRDKDLKGLRKYITENKEALVKRQAQLETFNNSLFLKDKSEQQQAPEQVITLDPTHMTNILSTSKLRIPKSIFDSFLQSIPIGEEHFASIRRNSQLSENISSQLSNLTDNDEYLANHIFQKNNELYQKHHQKEEMLKIIKDKEKSNLKKQPKKLVESTEPKPSFGDRKSAIDVVKRCLVKTMDLTLQKQTTNVEKPSAYTFGPGKVENLYQSQCQKQEFYDQSKRLITNPNSTLSTHANFYYDCMAQGSMPKPIFTKITRNILHLYGSSVPKGQSMALRNFLIEHKADPQYHIKELILDECLMTDEEFANILEGVIEQNTIKKLSFTGIPLNQKTCDLLCQMLSVDNGPAQIDQLYLTGVKLQTNNFLTIMQTISESMKLKKLKLSGMKLQHQGIIDSLYYNICENNELFSLNLSNCCVSPRNLVTIGKAISQSTTMQCINLSYIDIWESTARKKNYIQEFMQHLVGWIGDPDMSKNLKHIDLSGMNLLKENALRLCHVLSGSPNLVGIHLSDNGIDPETKNQIMQILSMNPANYVREANETQFDDLDHALASQIDQELSFQYGQGYVGEDEGQVGTTKMVNSELLTFHKTLNKMHQAKNLTGLAKKKLINDSFILNRTFGHPEMIFNRNRKNHRLLDFAAGDGQWQVTEKHEHCYVCNKFPIVQVYYRRGNPQMHQITDSKLVAQLIKMYSLDQASVQKSNKPVIFGSIPGYLKTSMIPVKLFAGLLIQGDLAKQDEQHINSAFVLKAFRREIQQMIVKDEDLSQKTRRIFSDYLTNWRQIIKNRQNDQSDILRVGPYHFDPSSSDECNLYIFSGFARPGRHSILIYDPMLKAIFVKNIILPYRMNEIQTSSTVTYVVPPKVIKRGVDPRRNIFAKWKHPGLKESQHSVQLDLASQEFTIGIYLNSNTKLADDESQEVADVLKINALATNEIFQIMQAHSPATYPLVQPEVADEILQRIGISAGPNSSILSIIDDIFDLQAIRREKLLTRIILMDLLVRVAMEQSRQNRDHSIGVHLLRLYQDKVIPYLLDNLERKMRRALMCTSAVNDILFVNKDNLKKTYKAQAGKEICGKFTFSCLQRVNDLIKVPLGGAGNIAASLKNNIRASFAQGSTVSDAPANLSEPDLRAIYALSKMHILNENIQHKKYESLAFIEFMFALLQIAQKLLPSDMSIETAVEEVIKTVCDAHQAPFVAVAERPFEKYEVDPQFDKTVEKKTDTEKFLNFEAPIDSVPKDPVIKLIEVNHNFENRARFKEEDTGYVEVDLDELADSPQNKKKAKSAKKLDLDMLDINEPQTDEFSSVSDNDGEDTDDMKEQVTKIRQIERENKLKL